ncbi:hypothetical protein [Lewinella sp. IMCC34191]|uniref:hypothetical protein n=1 Tax=Lewinella sp. IMCC34191 TaxID=2259172 RepID=UPI001300A86D|nr:hypothetical protein [Lewinella sp. IMCC34191]
MMQRFLYHIYLDGPATWRSKMLVLLELMPRFTEPYRPDQDRVRKRKIMRMNNRHIHNRRKAAAQQKNYRKAM